MAATHERTGNLAYSGTTNRQLTAILDDVALPLLVVCRMLRPFREEGTTFLAPFLGEGDDGRAVPPPEAVLDISPESLIRNWGKLAEWVQLEAKDVRIANDFRPQASRWLESGESKGYLLPIGLFNFFSGWYAKKKGPMAGPLPEHHPRCPAGPGPGGHAGGPAEALYQHQPPPLWSELVAARYGAASGGHSAGRGLMVVGAALEAERLRGQDLS